MGWTLASESAVTEYGYSTEMFLPWSMMAMPETTSNRTMGVYFSRKVAHIDERWGYPALPQTGSAGQCWIKTWSPQLRV